MQNEIEFTLNGIGYGAAGHASGFSWSNDLGEQGGDCATLFEAQQAAINWEAGRADRATQERDDAASSVRLTREQRFQWSGL